MMFLFLFRGLLQRCAKSLCLLTLRRLPSRKFVRFLRKLSQMHSPSLEDRDAKNPLDRLGDAVACLALVNEELFVFLEQLAVEQEKSRDLLGKNLLKSLFSFLGAKRRISPPEHFILPVVVVVDRRLDQ